MTDRSIRSDGPVEETDVVVIGAGPVGCATALQLGRLGHRVAHFERRDGLSRHPKAGGIHARTMEIFRRWGLSDRIREASRGALPPGARTSGFAWMTRLSGVELGRIDFGGPADLELWSTFSPEGPCFCGQDLYEPILFDGIGGLADVRSGFGKRGQFLAQTDESVFIDVLDEATGRRERTVRARYLVAADGVRSPTRHALGVGESGHGAFGDSINVQFRADLERHRAGRTYGLFWVVNADTQGALGWRRQTNRWSYNFEAAPGEDPQSYTPERCRDIIRLAIGDPGAELDITSILHWKHDQAVTDRWRVGRVFFVGDSAHRFPPHGGFGMNSGVQDSVNLVWKLDLALRGIAGDGLLDTYEAERKPVAEFNGAQCLENTRRMEETGWLVRDPQRLADIEKDTPDGRALREKIIASIPRQREQFYSQGQQFGTIYRSDAVLPDGAEPELSTVSEYRATGYPGARAPHIWLRDASGKELSTIDLFYDGFVIIAGPDGEAWRGAARQISKSGELHVAAHLVGAGGDFIERSDQSALTQVYGIEADGAVLVRPDGHIGFRARRAPRDPQLALRAALRRVTGGSPGLASEAAPFPLSA
jgi:putative polyketide hydroxylase